MAVIDDIAKLFQNSNFNAYQRQQIIEAFRQALAASGGTITVKEAGTLVSSVITTADFGAGFDVTESPSGEANVAIDLSELTAFTDALADIASQDARITVLESAVGGGGNSVTVTCEFGSSFTDKAQTVVTGQAWVLSNSEIIAQVLTPPGVDPDEIRLLNFKPVVSDLVAGTGFTLTLYSEPEAKGTYNVMCIGV